MLISSRSKILFASFVSLTLISCAQQAAEPTQHAQGKGIGGTGIEGDTQDFAKKKKEYTPQNPHELQDNNMLDGDLPIANIPANPSDNDFTMPAKTPDIQY